MFRVAPLILMSEESMTDVMCDQRECLWNEGGFCTAEHIEIITDNQTGLVCMDALFKKQ